MSQLNESIKLLEARRDAFRELKKILKQKGGRLLGFGPYGVRVSGRAWLGLKQSIEKAGGRFELKPNPHSKTKGAHFGHVDYDGHKFTVSHEPDALPGEGDLISFSDGSL